MKKVVMALLLSVILNVTFATPAFAGPPPDAGKGTAWNDGLGNALLHLLAVPFPAHANKWIDIPFGLAVVDWLWYPKGGPPPWFVPANYK